MVFLYLALGDKEEKWKQAVEKYGVRQNSYMATNSRSSKFVEEHKIQSIPRYMIVDENGKIIHVNLIFYFKFARYINPMTARKQELLSL